MVSNGYGCFRRPEYLEKDDAERQQLLTNVKLVLRYAHILEEEVRKRISSFVPVSMLNTCWCKLNLTCYHDPAEARKMMPAAEA